MRLLFDENLSPRLVAALADVFPGAAHVRDVGLASAPDGVVREFARKEGRILVTKDSDFYEGAFSEIKVVWIRRGNCSTRDIENILRRRLADISNLAATANLDMLMLY